MFARQFAAETPDKPAIIMATGGEVVTFAEYEAGNPLPNDRFRSPEGLFATPPMFEVLFSHWVHGGDFADGQPLDFGAAYEAIERIRDGSITEYRYDPAEAALVRLDAM